MNLSLDDLKPAEANFSLEDKPGKIYTLKKFSLAARIWMSEKYGDGIEGIFSKQKLKEISEIVYYLLKDKTDFPKIKDLRESVNSKKDIAAIITALLETIGLSEPVIKKMIDDDEKKSKKKK